MLQSVSGTVISMLPAAWSTPGWSQHQCAVVSLVPPVSVHPSVWVCDCGTQNFAVYSKGCHWCRKGVTPESVLASAQADAHSEELTNPGMSDDGISSERESTTSECAQEWVDNNVGLNDDMETSHCVSSNVESMPSKHLQKREDKVDESSHPMWIDVGPIRANSKERVCESDHDSSCGSTCVVSSLEHACSIGSDVARALRIQKYICASEGACLDELLKKHTSNTGSRSYKIATEIQRIKHAAVQMFNATSDFQVPVPVPVPAVPDAVETRPLLPCPTSAQNKPLPPWPRSPVKRAGEVSTKVPALSMPIKAKAVGKAAHAGDAFSFCQTSNNKAVSIVEKPVMSTECKTPVVLPSMRCLITGMQKDSYNSNVSEERLGDFFYSHGCSVTDVVVHTDVDQRFCRGTANVTFSDVGSVSKAISLNGMYDTCPKDDVDRPHGRLPLTGPLQVRRIVENSEAGVPNQRRFCQNMPRSIKVPLQPTQMGRVKEFWPHKKFGFIIKGGLEVFFHQDALVSRTVKKNDLVEFVEHSRRDCFGRVTRISGRQIKLIKEA